MERDWWFEGLSTGKKWTSVNMGRLIKKWIVTEEEIIDFKENRLSEKDILNLKIIKDRVTSILCDQIKWFSDQKVRQQYEKNI